MCRKGVGWGGSGASDGEARVGKGIGRTRGRGILGVSGLLGPPAPETCKKGYSGDYGQLASGRVPPQQKRQGRAPRPWVPLSPLSHFAGTKQLKM